jgi:hypothetical protein
MESAFSQERLRKAHGGETKMAISNENVYDYLVQALTDGSSRSTWVTGQVQSALEIVMDWRELHCHDMDLVAADHYLNMRVTAGVGGPAIQPTLEAAIVGYDAAKLVGLKAKTGTCPVSPADPGVRLWARAGVQDGLVDFILNLAGSNKQAKMPAKDPHLRILLRFRVVSSNPLATHVFSPLIDAIARW